MLDFLGACRSLATVSSGRTSRAGPLEPQYQGYWDPCADARGKAGTTAHCHPRLSPDRPGSACFQYQNDDRKCPASRDLRPTSLSATSAPSRRSRPGWSIHPGQASRWTRSQLSDRSGRRGAGGPSTPGRPVGWYWKQVVALAWPSCRSEWAFSLSAQDHRESGICNGGGLDEDRFARPGRCRLTGARFLPRFSRPQSTTRYTQSSGRMGHVSGRHGSSTFLAGHGRHFFGPA